MSDFEVINNIINVDDSKLPNIDIKEEIISDDLLLFTPDEVTEDPKFQIIGNMDVASNIELSIPEFDEKQISNLFTKYPIHLGPLCKNDDNSQDETTHYVKYKMQDGKHIKLFECGICSKEFGHQYTLIRHLPIHTDERKFQCTTCGKAFRQMSTLSQHRAIHSAERPFKCEICQKTFNRISTLISHRKTHTGLKPHQCHLCNKAFHQKGNLRNHIFTHTNERPYKCDLCKKGFNQMSNLMCHKIKAHKRSEKPKYACKVCGREFQKRMALRNHEQFQHGVLNNDSYRCTNGILVEPINTAAMQTTLSNNQIPFALLRPSNSIPVLVRILPAGKKQMLVPATAEDLRRHGHITITEVGGKKKNRPDSVCEMKSITEEVTIKKLGSTVQIKIPIVATIVQCVGEDGSMRIAIQSPKNTNEVLETDKYVLTAAGTVNSEQENSTISNTDFAQFNFNDFVDNHQILAPSKVQYLDQCGNVLTLEEYKPAEITYHNAAEIPSENLQLNNCPDSENATNLAITKPDQSKPGGDSAFPVLDKSELITVNDVNNFTTSTLVPFDSSMYYSLVLP